MKNSVLLDFADRISNTQSPLSVYEEFSKAQGAGGFFYGYLPIRTGRDWGDFEKDGFFHHTYSDEWQREIEGIGGLLENDFSTSLLSMEKPIVEWLLGNAPEFFDQLTTEQRRQYEIETDLGMVCGVSVCLDMRQTGFSGVGIWIEQATCHEEFLREWAEHGQNLLYASNLLDAAVRKERPNFFPKLTPREIDCLSWLASGFRPAEICWRLGISEKNFEKHIASAKRRLKSRTRDQALAKAVLMGLLPL